tara:strand:- start:2741 stop:3907 length:1167 start_codon:yes stop_codon:yes gene_type:complete
MKAITFVIPARNNLEFLKLSYDSLKKLKGNHHILILDDASSDGTSEWLDSLNDSNLHCYKNSGPKRVGIVGMFDKGIEMAPTDIIMAFHADMVAAPDLDDQVLKHLEKGKVVCATRAEPPIHPDGPEKVLVDLGTEVEDFCYDKFIDWLQNEYKPKHENLITQGMFAPWCMYKSDFMAVGGHDELFAPQSREDSDLFYRFYLNGYKLIQTWEGLVYHFTSRGSRFNKHSGGDTGVDSPEWKETNSKNERNFIRKWGTNVIVTELLHPVIGAKYDIGIVCKHCGPELLHALEPWCNTIYTDCLNKEIEKYIEEQQPRTLFNLKDRVKKISDFKYHQTSIFIDGRMFNQDDYSIIQDISNYIRACENPISIQKSMVIFIDDKKNFQGKNK